MMTGWTLAGWGPAGSFSNVLLVRSHPTLFYMLTQHGLCVGGKCCKIAPQNGGKKSNCDPSREQQWTDASLFSGQ